MKERVTLIASSNSLEFVVNSFLVSIFLLKKCMTGFIFLIWKSLMLLLIYPSLIHLFTISFGWLCSYLKYKMVWVKIMIDLMITTSSTKSLNLKSWILEMKWEEWVFFYFLFFHNTFVRLIAKHLLRLRTGEVNW